MRLREILPHANFVASAVQMSDFVIQSVSYRAMSVQSLIQRGQETRHSEWYSDCILDWRDHILALMLLRDCIGREMVRRGLTPPGPPMLARDWESGGMYLCVRSRDIPMPPWLEQMGRKQLAEAVVPAYDRGLCLGQEIDDE